MRGAPGAAPLSDEELRACRSRAQLLDRPTGVSSSEIEVVRRLLAVQAQEPHGALLAVRARCAGASADVLARAIAQERSLVTGWLGRGTLHLVCSEDYFWLLGLCAPGRLAGNRRRLGQEGVSAAAAERAVELIADTLATDGPLRRSELAARLQAAGIPSAGQATVHLIVLGALRGVAVVGPRVAGEPTLALASDWLGAPPASIDRATALVELCRRYLAGHGPATARDLAAWAGIGLREARRGFAGAAVADVGGGLFDLDARGTRGESQPARRPPASAAGGRDPGAETQAARLLPAFDPYMLGWKERSFAVAAEDRRRVHPGGGMLRAVATHGGRVVGTWGARRRDGKLQVHLDAFGSLGDEVVGELTAEAADIARFEGLGRSDPVLSGG